LNVKLPVLEAMCLVAWNLILQDEHNHFSRKGVSSIGNSSYSSRESQPVSSSQCLALITGLCRSRNEQTNRKFILFKIVSTCLRRTKSPLVSTGPIERPSALQTHTCESDDQFTHPFCYNQRELECTLSYG